MNPIRLNPVYISTIWAGHRLKNLRNLTDENIGISREVCAYKKSENTISEGEFSGMSIRTIIDNYHLELMGDDPTNQLIRVAYIDAKEDLSIQVHPDDEYAEKVENDYGKSESWYILECEEGATVAAGTSITDLAILKKAAQEGFLDKYIKKLAVVPGDFVLVPAGLIHACGKGILAIEIGSFGGITYRVFDYGRPRALDIDQSFEIIDPNLACTISHFPRSTEITETQLHEGIRHKSFWTDIIDVCGDYTETNRTKYVILTCVYGDCVVQVDNDYPLTYTQTLLIPATVTSLTIKGNCRIIKSYRP